MTKLLKPMAGLALALALGALLFSGHGRIASAATLCVSSDGSGGCYTSIQAAVSAAGPGDMITVAPGAYQESVAIGASVALIGSGADSTTIDAAGADNTIHIMADNVRVQGFTITGARLDGVLVENANRAEIMDNSIHDNASLVIPPAPGSPVGTPATDFNNVNLRNASDSIVANNRIFGSNGRGVRTEGSAIYDFPDQGINVTVTGRSDRNVIINNDSHGNAGGCGVVISTDSSDNIVQNNVISNNGTGIIVSALPPFGVSGTPFADHVPHSDGNIITNNTIQNNKTPGIEVSPISGTAIGTFVAGNTVSGNGPCPECKGTSVGIAVNAGNTPSSKADSNVVGPNNSVDGQQWGIAVLGAATNTQVFGNQVTVPTGGTALVNQATAADPGAPPAQTGS